MWSVYSPVRLLIASQPIPLIMLANEKVLFLYSVHMFMTVFVLLLFRLYPIVHIKSFFSYVVSIYKLVCSFNLL